jgi:hypothetical protein
METSAEELAAAALDAPDLAAFSSALWRAVMVRVPIETLPELVLMSNVLLEIAMDLDVYGPEGAERFITLAVHDHIPDRGQFTHEAEGWCRAIGAESLALALRAVIARFPDGRVAKGWSERVRAEYAIQPRLYEMLQAMPIDFAAARLEMLDGLQRYLRARRDEFVAQLGPVRIESARRKSFDFLFTIEDPDEFANAVERLASRSGAAGVDPRRLPDPIRMLSAVSYFVLFASGDGMGKFLDMGDSGEVFPFLLTWAGRLKSAGVVEYLERTAALFPDGCVPVDDVERMEAMDPILERRPNPFDALDAAYRADVKALPKLAQRYATRARLAKAFALLAAGMLEPGYPRPRARRRGGPPPPGR